MMFSCGDGISMATVEGVGGTALTAVGLVVIELFVIIDCDLFDDRLLLLSYLLCSNLTI